MKTLAEFEQFVKDAGLAIEEESVSFPTKTAAIDFADKARGQEFNVVVIPTVVAGSETWNVRYFKP
jgi:hypothetical protein